MNLNDTKGAATAPHIVSVSQFNGAVLGVSASGEIIVLAYLVKPETKAQGARPRSTRRGLGAPPLTHDGEQPPP
jgi:hypothetical protein